MIRRLYEMKVEEGSFRNDPKNARAGANADLGDYPGLLRVAWMRGLLVVVLGASVLAARVPILGFDFAFGGACGLLNMMVVARVNQRLLRGGSALGLRASLGLPRLALIACAAAFAGALGPWWGMAVFFGGFFAPLILFGIEARRRSRT